MEDKIEKVDRVYVFICKGDTCGKKGNPERVRVSLKQMAREFPAKSLKVSYVSCLGMCGDGPNVLICRGGTALHRCTGSESADIADMVRERIAATDQ
jgi:NADH:ubiquinone oxidoreductase subunit E